MAKTQHNAWPRTLRKGLFAGRTFRSQGEYNSALRELKRRANGRVNGIDAALVLRLVDAHDVLVEQGIGRQRAAEVVAALVR